MVTKPALDTTLPTEPPSILNRSLLALAALPTLMVLVPKNAPPLVTTRLLPALFAIPPIVTAPIFVMTPPLPISTRLLVAKLALPTWSTPPRRLMVALLPAAFAPDTVTVLLDDPQLPAFHEPTYKFAALTYPPLTTVTLLVSPGPPPSAEPGAT